MAGKSKIKALVESVSGEITLFGVNLKIKSQNNKQFFLITETQIVSYFRVKARRFCEKSKGNN